MIGLASIKRPIPFNGKRTEGEWGVGAERELVGFWP